MAERNLENIFITRDAPLVVREDSDTKHYGTVYLEDGAYIEIRAGNTFTVEELKPCFSMKHEDRAACVQYPTLKPAEKFCAYGGYDIIVTSASGSNGTRGENGGYGGGVGERGSHGAGAEQETRDQFLLSINKLERNVKVLSVGGQGGCGGSGGHGGEGWDGTSADDPGTIGGNGGNGGNGGRASDAVGSLLVYWEAEGGYELTVESKASAGGQGGKGGAAGANGRYYDGAVNPSRGMDGLRGGDGNPGEVNRVFKFDEGANPLAGMFADTADKAAARSETTDSTATLDFSDPAQARNFLNHFGGEDYLSENYPAFYKAYTKTVERARQEQLSSKLPDGTISSSFGVTAINTGLPSVKRMSGSDHSAQSMMEVFNYTEAHDAESRFSIISGEMQNETDHIILESFGVTSFGKNFEYKLSTRPLDYVGVNGKKLREISYRAFVNNNALLGAEKASSEAVLVNGCNSIVKNITITMPKSTSGNNPLIYLYNRTPVSGETSDKSYDSNQVGYNDKDNTVNTLMGISGSLTFNSDAGVTEICGYSMKSDTDNRKLMVEGTGAALFNYAPTDITKFFTPAASEKAPQKQMTVNFAFPDDWKCRLNKNVYDNGAKSVIVHLLFSFYYKIKITDPNTQNYQLFDMPITIKSASSLAAGQQYYVADNSTTVLIPPIKIRWGCFAAGTRIRMADGTERRICDLKCGDMVATPAGGKAVTEVYYGTDKSLIHIRAMNGSEMAVTKDHPVLTKRGVIRAEHLSAEDEIKLEDGSHGRLLAVYETDYEEGQPVYNIEVDGGLIYAEGFLAGEYETQNDLARFEESGIFGKYGAIVPGEVKEKEFPEDAKAVAEELRQICRERFGIPV